VIGGNPQMSGSSRFRVISAPGVPRHLDHAPSRVFTLIDSANDRHDLTLYAWPTGECRWYLHHSDDRADALSELREGLEVLRRSVDEWLRSA